MANRRKAVNSVDLIKPATHGELMDRVISILDQARANVVRAVNSNMVIAYWLIGREIIQAVQGGEDRADYGKRLLQDLSQQLTERYGRGFSVTNIRYFRLFYQAYSYRSPEIRHKACDEFEPLENMETFLKPVDNLQGFSAQLSWSHYRTLCAVENLSERLFYIDLVFYNYLLKCFVLINLKMGHLTHQDVGQMDMYVRMFDELRRGQDDNPSVGLILCAERDEVVARYSVLHESAQLFASKYMLYLPTEAELIAELEREQATLLGQIKQKKGEPDE